MFRGPMLLSFGRQMIMQPRMLPVRPMSSIKAETSKEQNLLDLF
jgi:hypothetical protein